MWLKSILAVLHYSACSSNMTDLLVIFSLKPAYNFETISLHLAANKRSTTTDHRKCELSLVNDTVSIIKVSWDSCPCVEHHLHSITSPNATATHAVLQK